MLREEFPDVEGGPNVIAFPRTAGDVDKVRKCFQSPMLISALGADLNQIGDRTSAVAGFRDLFSASPRPSRRGQRFYCCSKGRGRVPICVRPVRPYLRPRFKPALPDSLRPFPSGRSPLDSSRSAEIHRRSPALIGSSDRMCESRTAFQLHCRKRIATGLSTPAAI